MVGSDRGIIDADESQDCCGTLHFVFLISVCLVTTSCDYHTVAATLNYPIRCESESDLERFLARESLGDNVEMQSLERLVFAQTFPYSGVCASHLYVYSEGDGGLSFVSFFRVPDNERVSLKLVEDHSIAIEYGSHRLAVVNSVVED
jgi:hypothetical protein